MTAELTSAAQHLFCSSSRVDMLYASITHLSSQQRQLRWRRILYLGRVCAYSFRLESIVVAPRSIVFDRHSRGGATQRRAVSTINCASNRIILGRMFDIRIDLASIVQLRCQRKLVKYDRSWDGTVTYRLMVMTNNKVNTGRTIIIHYANDAATYKSYSTNHAT